MKKKNHTAEKTKREKVGSFDPNGPALKAANVFGLPFTSDESDIVLIPVPWEVTVSSGGGTSRGPSAIKSASFQVDLFHPEFPDLWKRGISMEPISSGLQKKSTLLKKEAMRVIDAWSAGKDPSRSSAMRTSLEKVNQGGSDMIDSVQHQCSKWLDKGKLVGLVGGDHSTPLGLLRALALRNPSFGILQIDAHMDLRNAYEGFTYSHASIMYNALQLKQVSKLVQLGIRDFCEEEREVVNKSKGRVEVFYYADVAAARAEGVSWKRQCKAIVDALPSQVYISFDIDGLDPKLCPDTGTPVPGGFEFHEITYLLSMLAATGRKIIGFDLNEVSPGKTDWNGNVGARMLFHLCGIAAKSQGKV